MTLSEVIPRKECFMAKKASRKSLSRTKVVIGMVQNSLVWLSYDLGINGDYDGMYTFLDRYSARECGDSLACFYYPRDANGLLADLKSEVSLNVKRDRVYLIYMKNDGKYSGKFIFGKRRRSPWEGLSGTGSEEEDS